MVAYAFIHLFFAVICASFFLSLWSYIFLITKTTLAIFIHLVLLLCFEDTSVVQVAAYSVLGVAAIEILEAVFKLARLVLRNKGIIPDSYQPFESVPEAVAE